MSFCLFFCLSDCLIFSSFSLSLSLKHTNTLTFHTQLHSFSFIWVCFSLTLSHTFVVFSHLSHFIFNIVLSVLFPSPSRVAMQTAQWMRSLPSRWRTGRCWGRCSRRGRPRISLECLWCRNQKWPKRSSVKVEEQQSTIMSHFFRGNLVWRRLN